MRKLIFSALTSLVLLSNCQCHQRNIGLKTEDIEVKDGRERWEGRKNYSMKFIESKGLVVSGNITDPYYFSFRGERDGINDLADFSETSWLEEGYIFVPRLGLWIETGSWQTDDNFVSNNEIMESAARDFGDVTHYHFHDIKGNEKLERRVVSCLPSDRDVSNAAKSANEIKKIADKSRLIYRVVSPYGVSQIIFKNFEDNPLREECDYRNIMNEYGNLVVKRILERKEEYLKIKDIREATCRFLNNICPIETEKVKVEFYHFH